MSQITRRIRESTDGLRDAGHEAAALIDETADRLSAALERFGGRVRDVEGALSDLASDLERPRSRLARSFDQFVRQARRSFERFLRETRG